MGKKYRVYKNSLERYLESSKGRRFFNFFYSWGASIVILGALFKIEHYAFGSYMLYVGMITEAIVFFLSAFDTPAKEYKWEDVYPVLRDSDDEGFEEIEEEVVKPAIQRTSTPANTVRTSGESNSTSTTTSVANGSGSTGMASQGGGFSGGTQGGASGGTVILGGGSISDSTSNAGATGNLAAGSSGGAGTVILGGGGGSGSFNGSAGSYSSTGSNTGSKNDTSNNVVSDATAADGHQAAPYQGGILDVNEASERYVAQLSSLSQNMEKFAKVTDSLTQISDTLLNSFKSITDNSDGISNNTRGYVNQMEALNRNVSGLNTIYEVQLKGVSGQIHTIEEINAGLDRMKKLYGGSLADSSIFKSETEKMAQQLVELNRVYARMIQAMTTNMNMNMGGGNIPPSNSETF